MNSVEQNTLQLQTQSVLAAVQSLVAAFARHDTAAYFAAFSADASFIFHTTPEILHTRAAYEALWQSWEKNLGFKVLSCQSSAQAVQLFGDTAVFNHRVRTVLQTHEGQLTLDERETIVFHRTAEGPWLAVHEHLSPLPVDACGANTSY